MCKKRIQQSIRDNGFHNPKQSSAQDIKKKLATKNSNGGCECEA